MDRQTLRFNDPTARNPALYAGWHHIENLFFKLKDFVCIAL